jgi:large subunit ribosomal protein L28
MSRVCQECGKGPIHGVKYKRRGKAKREGGVGRKIVGQTPRRFIPNLQRLRVVLENGTHKTVRLCTNCMKTLTHKGRLPNFGALTKRAARKLVFAGE